MYRKISALAQASLLNVKSVTDKFTPPLHTAVLIEVCRNLDYQNVISCLSKDGLPQSKIPEQTIIDRGWNPVMAQLLPHVGKGLGEAVPLMESTPELANHAMSLIYNMGVHSILKDSADMIKHGMAEAEEIDGKIVFSMSDRCSEDHYLDRIEDSRILDVENELAPSEPYGSILNVENRRNVRKKMEELVFPWQTNRGTMIGYGAEPIVDDYFLAVVSDRTLKWRDEAGIHPDSSIYDVSGGDVAAILLLILSTRLKHIDFVGLGCKLMPEANCRMSLTVWKPMEELIDDISEFSGIDKSVVSSVISLVTVDHSHAECFQDEYTPLVPLFIRVSEKHVLEPVSGIFRNPFNFIHLLHADSSSKNSSSVRSFREEWMRNDLYHLFMGNRYDRVDGNSRLAKNGQTVTDIDAAIYDRSSRELALFQLKWQDFNSNNVKVQRSKAKNFVSQVDLWAQKVSEWISDFGAESLCRSLRLRLPRDMSVDSIKLFAIGRSKARFKSYGYDSTFDAVSTCTWNQFVRLRYEVGSVDSVFSHLQERVIAEKISKLDLTPLPHEVNINGQKVIFKDLWNVYADESGT